MQEHRFHSRMMTKGSGPEGGGQGGVPKPEKSPHLESGDLQNASVNLNKIQLWLITEVKEAWHNYKINPRDNKRAKKLFTILEKGPTPPVYDKIGLLEFTKKTGVVKQEDFQAFKDLLYFKNITEKGSFIRNFDFVYYLENISHALLLIANKLRTIGRLKKISRRLASEPVQGNLDFEGDLIDPSAEEEL